jgi:hypothetical protein
MWRARRLANWVVALALSSSFAHAAGSEPKPSDEQKSAAQQTFDAGSKLYDSHRFDQALVAFQASYRIVASPNSHLMVARCLRETGHHAEAYREFQAVVLEANQRGNKYASAASSARDELAELKRDVALLTLQVKDAPAGFSVTVGGAPVDVATLAEPLALEPGDVTVTGDAPNGDSAGATATLAPGAEQTLALEFHPKPPPVPDALPPPAPAPPPAHDAGIRLRTWSYVAGGIGVAGAVTFVAFGAMSSSKYDELDSGCPNHVCPPGKQGDIDSGKRFQTIADVGLAIGIVGLATGVTLFVIDANRSHGDRASQGDLAVRVGAGSVAFRGAF